MNPSARPSKHMRARGDTSQGSQLDLPSDRAATKAVVMLLAHRMAAWSSSTPPRERAPRHTAASAARKPTTVAWTCSGEDGGHQQPNSSVREGGFLILKTSSVDFILVVFQAELQVLQMFGCSPS